LKRQLKTPETSLESQQERLCNAVITNDLATVKHLRHIPFQQYKNRDGFSILELAEFLGRTDLLPLLKQLHRYPILVTLKGSNQSQWISFEEVGKVLGFHYISQSFFVSYEDLLSVKNACPWLFKLPLITRENWDWGRFFQERLSNGSLPPVFLQYIDDILGYSLFAAEDLEENLFIGEYVGALREIDTKAPEINSYCLLYPSRFLAPHFFIDAKEKGNLLRFVNHSDRPNCKMICVITNGIIRPCLVSTRPILKGEALTFDYKNSGFTLPPPKYVSHTDDSSK